MKKIFLLLICASFIACVLKCCDSSQVEAVPATSPNDEIQYAEDSFPSCLTINDSIKWMISYSDIEHPDIVYAQAILETGHFTSDIFIQNNNLFGMKFPKIRETKATGENMNHATFESWIESVEDYKLWQDSFASGKTRDEYFTYLGSVYAQDKRYVTKLKKIIERNKLNDEKFLDNMKILVQK